MPPRRWDIRIRDILLAIAKIEEYTRRFDYDSFKSDTKTVDAGIRKITGSVSAWSKPVPPLPRFSQTLTLVTPVL